MTLNLEATLNEEETFYLKTSYLLPATSYLLPVTWGVAR